MPLWAAVRSVAVESMRIPRNTLNVLSPRSTMKTTVPMRAPVVLAERSPYPMVVMEMTLYQRASSRVMLSSAAPSKR